jgi:hypothetical protein
MKSPQGKIAMAKDKDGNTLKGIQEQFFREELAKLQGQGGGAPSGGGALDPSQYSVREK